MAETTTQRPRSGRPAVYDMTSQQCIWSAAGVVPYRLCHNAFDCTTCSFDRKMQRERGRAALGRSSARPTWREKARQGGSLESHRCRHMLSGYVPVKYCSHNFECATCEYDQLIEEEIRSQEVPETPVELVAGFALAPGYYYHRGHTWARVEYGGQVRVGIDDFAARLLGPPEGLELPALGSALNQGEPGVELRRGGHRAGMLSPVQGIVVAVNPNLRHRPGLANHSPYASGWCLILQPTRLTRDLRSLLFGTQTEGWLDHEAGRLAELLDRESGYRLAATGGRVVEDIYGSVEGLDWDELVQGFLLT